MNFIHIFLVDDQRLMRDGLRTLLELEDDLTVVGEAGDGRAALDAYPALHADARDANAALVTLMDVRMPDLDGVAATRQICADWPDAKIIVLTTFDEDKYVFEGLRAGAKGFLLKATSGDDLARAIRTVAAGQSLVDPAVTARVVAAAMQRPAVAEPSVGLVEPLSERETEVLRLLAEGLSNREIAGRLFLAEGTVKNYVTNILQKISVRDRTQAALRGRELGLL